MPAARSFTKKGGPRGKLREGSWDQDLGRLWISHTTPYYGKLVPYSALALYSPLARRSDGAAMCAIQRRASLESEDDCRQPIIARAALCVGVGPCILVLLH